MSISFSRENVCMYRADRQVLCVLEKPLEEQTDELGPKAILDIGTGAGIWSGAFLSLQKLSPLKAVSELGLGFLL
jgi:methylase of polypeptide subunit release factors